MDKRSHLKPKKEKEGKAPHLQRQKAAQMQSVAPQAPIGVPPVGPAGISQHQR